jgi:hypothetical protein
MHRALQTRLGDEVRDRQRNRHPNRAATFGPDAPGGAGVTTSGIDFQQGTQRSGNDKARPPHRRRLALAAAAAVLLVLAAAGAGSLWLRHQPPTVPASPQGVGTMTGLWRYQDYGGSGLYEVRADGTLTEYGSTTTLLRSGVGDGPRHLTNDGQQIIVDSTDAQGRHCRRTQPILAQSAGQLSLGTSSDTGTGCQDPAAAPATMTRLSPAPGPLPPASAGPTVAVTDPVQLEGLWLLQGTPSLLAVDEIGGPAAYLIGHDGNLESSLGSHGNLSVGPDGVIVLNGAGCPQTTLRRAQVQGSGIGQTLTAVVDTDPCNQLGGQTTQTWVRVF